MQRTVNFLMAALLCVGTAVASENVEKNYLPADTNIVVPEKLDFTYAAEAARPSVVHIKTYSKSNPEEQLGDPFEEILKELYGDKYKEWKKQNETSKKSKTPQPAEQEYPLGSGSGVIISADGYIITNNHITEGAERIEVSLNDNRTYTAKFIGTDPSTDVAIIKIEEKDLKPIKYGNSDKVKVGEWVIAVGNPFNLSSTVTAGIVSAKGRNLNILREKDDLAIESFIQTDAAVNPGNSGGALVNINGELIGINTAIASPTGSYAGYSFAVPVNLVRKVVDDIMKYGQVQRGILGVMIQDINAEEVKAKGVKDYRGVYIASVNKGSAADKGGIKPGDIILKINDMEVNSPAELQEMVATLRPGDKMKITYKRGDKVDHTEVTLQNTGGTTELIKFDPEAFESKIGAQLRTLETQELQDLRIQNGILVGPVRSGKFREAGIRDGFIITHLDRKPVRNITELKDILQKSKGKGGVLISGIYKDGQKSQYAISY